MTTTRNAATMVAAKNARTLSLLPFEHVGPCLRM
jgi:hypothetical protein